MMLPPDIRLGLAGYPVTPARAALSALHQVYARRTQAADWSGSDLTGDGFPFEMSFTTADDTLRFTCDPAAHLPPGERLPSVLDAAARLGSPVDHPLLGALPQTPRIGAWLGGRVDSTGKITCKLYADWSTDTPACPRLTLPGRLPCGQRPMPRMIGLGPGPTRTEIYYRFEAATLRTLCHVLDHAGLSAAKDDLSRLIGPRLRARQHIGISLASDGPGAPTVATVYLFARSFWGSDKRCRGRTLALLQRAGRDPRPYARASAPLRHHHSPQVHHGLVALSFTPKGHMWGIGLRPALRP